MRGQEHPIAFFSRKLLPQEESYSTIAKECLANKLGIQAFKVNLLGRPYQVQTEHQALVWLNKFKDKTSRLTCWSFSLQPFDYDVTHRKGKTMQMWMYFFESHPVMLDAEEERSIIEWYP